MRHRHCLLQPLALLLLLAAPAAAQFQTGWHSRLSKTFQLTLYSSTIDQPILREPNIDTGGLELPVDQSRRVTGGKLSWMYAGKKVGVDVGLVLWRTEVADFTLRREDFRDTTYYTDASVRYLFFDTGLQWAPLARVPLGIYGVFGMGVETEKYHTTPASEPGMASFYGDRNSTEFQYSYGGGVRLYPVHNLGITAELRWIPGDLTSKGGTCWYGSYGSASWSSCGGETENFTRVLSIGAFLILL